MPKMSTKPFRDCSEAEYQKWIFETLREELTKIKYNIGGNVCKKILKLLWPKEDTVIVTEAKGGKMYQRLLIWNVVFTIPGGLIVTLQHLNVAFCKISKSLFLLALLTSFLCTKVAIAQVITEDSQTVTSAEATQTTTDEATQKRIEELIVQLGNTQYSVRESAVEALGKMGQPSVQYLIKALKNKDPRIRGAAVDALRKVGQPAIEYLIRKLEDENGPVCVSAANALSQIGLPVVQSLITVLGNEIP